MSTKLEISRTRRSYQGEMGFFKVLINNFPAPPVEVVFGLRLQTLTTSRGFHTTVILSDLLPLV